MHVVTQNAQTADSEQIRQTLVEASRAFDAGEIQSAAADALRAAEMAHATGDEDLVAAAALIVDGVPDPSTAATVEQIAKQALSTGTPGNDAVRARLHSQLAIALHLREQFRESSSEVELAMADAARTNDPRALAAALHARGLAIAGQADGTTLLDLGGKMLEAALQSRAPTAELAARSWRVDAPIRLGETGQAEHEIDAMDVLAARTGMPLARWNALLARAGLNHSVGRFDEAEGAARQARGAMPEISGRKRSRCSLRRSCSSPPIEAAFRRRSSWRAGLPWGLR